MHRLSRLLLLLLLTLHVCSLPLCLFASGANVTFNATVVPRNEGPWDAPRARVDYIDSADNTEKVQNQSTHSSRQNNGGN